jgi:hypothetical protein
MALINETAEEDIKYVLKTYSQKGKQLLTLLPINKHVKWLNNNRPWEATLLKAIEQWDFPILLCFLRFVI